VSWRGLFASERPIKALITVCDQDVIGHAFVHFPVLHHATPACWHPRNIRQDPLTQGSREFNERFRSFFILNMRENNLVSAQITAIQLENQYFQSNAKLYQTSAQTQPN
jgi:hypothetical protein